MNLGTISSLNYILSIMRIKIQVVSCKVMKDLSTQKSKVAIASLGFSGLVVVFCTSLHCDLLVRYDVQESASSPLLFIVCTLSQGFGFINMANASQAERVSAAFPDSDFSNTLTTDLIGRAISITSVFYN